MKAVRIAGIMCMTAGMLIFLTPQIREARQRLELQNLQRPEIIRVIQETEQGESRTRTGETCDTSAESGSASTEEEEALYTRMEAYNRKLSEEGQEIAGPENYEQNPLGEDGAIGSVRIPDMDVELPLYLGATYEHLDKGAAVLGGTSMPVGGTSSNCVISGHRSWCGAPYFRDIEQMKAGSEVVIYNGRETLYYRAFEIRIILPDDTDSIMIRPGRDLVTLITCHPYLGGGTHRYVVYCERCKENEHESNPGEPEGTETAQESVSDYDSESTESIRPAGEKDSESSLETSAAMIRMEYFVRCAVAVVMVAAGAAVVLKRGRKRHRK